MLLAKEQASRPINVVLRPPEIVDWDHDPGRQCLQFPSALVIAQSPDGPQQEGRCDHVKQAQQANWQADPRVEHIFRPADQVMTAQERGSEIDCE